MRFVDAADLVPTIVGSLSYGSMYVYVCIIRIHIHIIYLYIHTAYILLGLSC